MESQQCRTVVSVEADAGWAYADTNWNLGRVPNKKHAQRTRRAPGCLRGRTCFQFAASAADALPLLLIHAKRKTDRA